MEAYSPRQGVPADILQGFHAMDRHEIGQPPKETVYSAWTLGSFEMSWNYLGQNAILGQGTLISPMISLASKHQTLYEIAPGRELRSK